MSINILRYFRKQLMERVRDAILMGRQHCCCLEMREVGGREVDEGKGTEDKEEESELKSGWRYGWTGRAQEMEVKENELHGWCAHCLKESVVVGIPTPPPLVMSVILHTITSLQSCALLAQTLIHIESDIHRTAECLLNNEEQ